MAKPVPTPDQIAAIQQTVSDQTNMQNALNASAALQDPAIDQATKVDQAFKDLFAWYNDKIIGKYEAEQKALNGVFVTNPVTETDIVNVGSTPPSGRLIPTPPATDIVRIPEFDGGNTSVATNYEQIHITDQAAVENTLVNGYGGGSFPLTLTTDTNLTPTSTTLSLRDTAVAITSVTPGSVFVVTSFGDLAVVKCLTITPNDPGPPPPYVSDLTIELIVPPTGTITSGQTLEAFTGFTNAERTTKITSDPDFQPLMNYLVAQLQSKINARKARLAEQLAALSTNEDPDGVANITTATTNVNNSDSFLTSYLITTDISNTGLASLSSERGTRSSQITTRLAQITSAYTGQTENYYNARYANANNRGNTFRGTLRTKSNAQSVKDNSLNMASSLSSSIGALNGILPP